MLKNILIGAGVLVVVIAAGVYFFLLPPSAKSLCEKQESLVRKYIAETTGMAVDSELVKAEAAKKFTNCEKTEQRRQDTQGLLKYTPVAKCVMKANTAQEADMCGKKK